MNSHTYPAAEQWETRSRVIMVVYLVNSAFGLFVIDKDSRVISEEIIYPDAALSASELIELNRGKTTERIRKIGDVLQQTGDATVTVDSSLLAKALPENSRFHVVLDEVSSPIRWFRNSHDTHLIDTGIVKSESEMAKFRHSVSLMLARVTLSDASSETDMLVKQAIDAIDELDKSINVVAMRAREWYSLYNPSVSRLVEDHQQFGLIATKLDDTSKATVQSFTELGIADSVAQSIVDSSLKEVGASLSKTDLGVIRTLAGSIEQLYATRRELEQYVASMMQVVAPNLTMIVGPVVGARLISLAGSLKDLARRPSSTVQVFGAEKALFRSLKTGTDPPKHGVIFQVPEIYSAPYWQRGRIARAVAGKVAIAARIDAFSKRNLGESIRADLLRRIEEIRQHNPEEPPPKPPRSLKKPTSTSRQPQRPPRKSAPKRYGGRRP